MGMGRGSRRSSMERLSISTCSPLLPAADRPHLGQRWQRSLQVGAAVPQRIHVAHWHPVLVLIHVLLVLLKADLQCGKEGHKITPERGEEGLGPWAEGPLG